MGHDVSRVELEQKANQFLKALYYSTGGKVGVGRPYFWVGIGLGNTGLIDLVVSHLEQKKLVVPCVVITTVRKSGKQDELQEEPGAVLTEAGLSEAQKLADG